MPQVNSNEIPVNDPSRQPDAVLRGGSRGRNAEDIQLEGLIQEMSAVCLDETPAPRRIMPGADPSPSPRRLHVPRLLMFMFSLVFLVGISHMAFERIHRAPDQQVALPPVEKTTMPVISKYAVHKPASVVSSPGVTVSPADKVASKVKSRVSGNALATQPVSARKVAVNARVKIHKTLAPKSSGERPVQDDDLPEPVDGVMNIFFEPVRLR